MSQPDPGGNFESEYHRRAAAALADPDEGYQSIGWSMERVRRDDFFDVDIHELTDLVNDLEADGDAEKDEEDNWKLTEQGHDALTGQNAWNGGRAYGETT